MKRKFTLLIAALALLTMIVQPGRAWGQTSVTFTAGVDTGATSVTKNGITVSMSTMSRTDNYRTYANSDMTVSSTVGNIQSVVVTCTANGTSNNGPGKFSVSANSSGSYTYESNGPNGTWTGASDEMALTASAQVRMTQIVVTYDDGGSTLEDNDIALIGAPVALSFDLYNNSSAQVINYTTSSSGTVTIANNSYIETEVDQVNKTITVTPSVVTNGEKTITVNQAADDNYYAGSKTFTVNITDSTPFAGGDVTFTAGTDVGSFSGNNSPDEMVKNGVTVYGNDAAFATAQYRLYQSSTTTISVESGTITSIVFNGQSTSYPVSRLSVNDDNGSYTVSNNVGTWTGNSNEVSFDASGQVRLSSIVVTVAAPTSNPYITAVNVDIDYDVTGGNITYTINNEPNPAGSLTAAIKDGTTPTIANFSLGSITGEAVTFTCGANTESTAHTAEVTLTYTYNTNETVTKDVTITQAAAPIVYTSIPALFAAATTTETNVLVTFNNWVVSGVSTNGKNIFVTDNNGNGFVIYYNSDMSSIYAAGKILSGTAVSCTLKKYNGFAELLNVDESDLTITTEGTVTVAEVAMADLAGVNTGALLHYNDLTCSVNNNKYYLSDGTTTLQVYTSLYDFGSLENGKSYHITGVYQQYNSTKEILPRSAADVVKAADMSATVFSGLTAFSYVVNNGPSAAQYVGIDGSDFAGNLTITASSDYEICTTENGTYNSSIEVEQEQGEIAETLYIRLKAGLATGEHNGTLTFTATNLTTIEQALEGTVTASATYDIMIDSTIAHGTVTASASVAEAGTTITLTATPDECYQFVEWVTEPDNLTWTSSNQFTMPDEDVLISATFSQIVYTIQYSVNGVVESGLQENVNCGSTASLWNEDYLEIAGVELPTECSLLGWSSASGNTEILSSLEPEANATLYAVLAYGDTSYDLVTSVSELSVGDIIVIASNIYDYAMSTTQNTNNRGQAAITKTDNHITITTSVCEFVLGEGNVDNTWSFYDGTQSGYIYAASSSSNHLKTEASLSNNSSWEISISEGIASVTAQGSNTHNVLQYNNGNSLFSCYSSASQTAISLYKKHSSAYTNVLVEDLTGNVTITEPTYIPAGTIVDAGAYTITTNPEDLILEDGAQLIHTAAVNATIQKNVTAASSWKSKGVDGWHFIASPVDGLSTSVVASDHYDLYKYDEASAYWIYDHGASAATPFNTLERGKGYLYASKDPTTLDFAGSMEATNATVQKDLSWACSTYPELKGFNLMGNPFTRNLTTGDMKIGETAVTSYYGINAATNDIITYSIADDPIKPGQGFMVQATAASQKLIFNPTSKESDGIYEGYISIKAGNDNSMDKAFIQIGNGNTLRKMTLSDNTMVYVMNGDEDYAAARVEELAGSMPVHFKAIEAGTQTITIEAKDIEAYSMKLIDNFTNEVIDLLLEPTYTFEAEVDDDEARFVLVFDFNNYTNVEESFENSHFAYQFGDELILNGNGTLQVFDIMGRFVMSREINGSERISTTALNTGVYVLRLNDNIQKIVVK